LQTTDPSSRQRGRPKSTNPQLSDNNKDLVVSPRRVLYSKTVGRNVRLRLRLSLRLRVDGLYQIEPTRSVRQINTFNLFLDGGLDGVYLHLGMSRFSNCWLIHVTLRVLIACRSTVHVLVFLFWPSQYQKIMVPHFSSPLFQESRPNKLDFGWTPFSRCFIQKGTQSNTRYTQLSERHTQWDTKTAAICRIGRKSSDKIILQRQK
jgi:hypothetical protein